MNAAIILAAGESLRMGFPKQLAEYKGSTILETTIDTVSAFFEDTVVDIMQNRLTYGRLVELSDLDTIYDLRLLQDFQ